MKDTLAHLEKLRTQVCECELIRDLATDHAERELFDRLARHLGALADEIIKGIASETISTIKPPALQMTADCLALESTRDA